MKDWQDLAKCKGLSPELFFPVGPGLAQKGVSRADRQRTDRMELDTADFCHGRGAFPGKKCNVIDHCLEYAVSNNEDGVYGGTSSNQRIQIRRKKTA